MSIVAGASLGGPLTGSYGDVDVGAGWLVGAAGGFTAVEADGGVPFVDLTLALSAGGRPTTTASGVHATLTAVDLRVGVTVGWSLWDVWRPYLAARAFGGPIFWETDGRSITGTDRGHVQLAVGSTIALPGGVSIFGEWAPWYERGASAGLAVGF